MTIDAKLYLIFIGVYLMAITMGACNVDEVRFDNVMQSEGYEDVTQGKYDWFECGWGDELNSSFRAKNVSTGLRVNGTVCCGVFKGCTVRWQ